MYEIKQKVSFLFSFVLILTSVSSFVVINAQTSPTNLTTSSTSSPTTSTTTTTFASTIRPKSRTVTWNNTRTISLSYSKNEIPFVPRGLPNQESLRIATEVIGIIAGIFSTPLTSMAVARGMSIYQLAGCNHKSSILASDIDLTSKIDSVTDQQSTSLPRISTTTRPSTTTTTTRISTTTSSTSTTMTTTTRIPRTSSTTTTTTSRFSNITRNNNNFTATQSSFAPTNTTTTSPSAFTTTTTSSPQTVPPSSSSEDSSSSSAEPIHLIDWINAPIPFPESFFPDFSLMHTRGGPARATIISFTILFVIVFIFSMVYGYIVFFGWISFSKCSCGWTDLEWWWALASVSPIPNILGLTFALFSGFWFRAMGVLSGGAERSSFLLDVVILTILPMLISVVYIGNFFARTFKPVLAKYHGTRSLGVVESVACCDAGLLEKIRMEEEADDAEEEKNNEKKKKKRATMKKQRRDKQKKPDDNEEPNSQPLIVIDDSSDESDDDHEEEKENFRKNDNIVKNKLPPSSSPPPPPPPKKWKLRLLRFLNSSIGNFFFVGSLMWDSEKKGSTSTVLVNRCGKYMLTDYLGIVRRTNRVALLAFSHNNNAAGSNNSSKIASTTQQILALQQKFDESGTILPDVDENDQLHQTLLHRKHNLASSGGWVSSASFAGRAGGTDVVISIRRSLTAYSYFVHLVLCSIVCFLSGIARSKLLADFVFVPSFRIGSKVVDGNNNNNSNDPCESIRGLTVFFEVIHVAFFIYNSLYLRPVVVPFDNLMNGCIEVGILASTFLLGKSDKAEEIQSLLAGLMIPCCLLMIMTRLFSFISLWICDGAKRISQIKHSEFVLEKMNAKKMDEQSKNVLRNNNNNNNNHSTPMNEDELMMGDYHSPAISPSRHNNNNDRRSQNAVSHNNEHNDYNNEQDNQEKEEEEEEEENDDPTTRIAVEPVHPLSQPHYRYCGDDDDRKEKNKNSKKGEEWEKEFEDIDQALRNAHSKGDSKSSSQFKMNLDKLFSV